MDSTQNETKHRCHVVAMPILVEATSSADILISFVVTEEWLGFGQDVLVGPGSRACHVLLYSIYFNSILASGGNGRAIGLV